MDVRLIAGAVVLVVTVAVGGYISHLRAQVTDLTKENMALQVKLDVQNATVLQLSKEQQTREAQHAAEREKARVASANALAAAKRLYTQRPGADESDCSAALRIINEPDETTP